MISIGGGLGFSPGATYKATFFRGGRAALTSRDEIEKDVEYEGEVTFQSFGRLCLLAQRLRFDKLVRLYSANVSDAGGATVSVTVGGREHTVGESGSTGPIELWALEIALQAVKQRVRWMQK
jgi:hypothetical protein